MSKINKIKLNDMITSPDSISLEFYLKNQAAFNLKYRLLFVKMHKYKTIIYRYDIFCKIHQ
jgi:hypothetical protein